MPSLLAEHEQWFDELTSEPINAGYIYIGAVNLDPQANPITIYSDRDLSVPITNPQRTGTDGRSENKIWVPGQYSIEVEDSANVQKYISMDNGRSMDDSILVGSSLEKTTGTPDTVTLNLSSDAEWINLGDTPTYATTTTFTITGDVTSEYDVGRRIRCTDASTLYGEITASSYSSPDTTVTVSLDSGSLSASLTAVSVGIISGQNPAYKSTTEIDTDISTGETEYDITVPTWPTKIHISFVSMSTNGTGIPVIQLGTVSGGLLTNNYFSAVSQASASAIATELDTAYFQLATSTTGATVWHGNLTLIKNNGSWSVSGMFNSSTTLLTNVSGSRATASPLNLIRLTTTTGTHIFDSGDMAVRFS